MLIHSTSKAHGSASKATNKVGQFVAQKPFRTLMDVVDVGLGTTLCLGYGGNNAQVFLEGAGNIAGAVHTFSALYNGIKAADISQIYGGEKQARKLAMRALGDGIAAAGMFAAAAGVGPASMAFVGLGALTATLASL